MAAVSSFPNKAVTIITKPIPDLHLLVHKFKTFLNYYFGSSSSSSSSSSKQTVDNPQTIVELISMSSDQGDNNTTQTNQVIYHTTNSPSCDHCIRIINPSPEREANALLVHQQNPNPKLSIIQKAELGKMAFGVVVPITMGLLVVIWSYSSSSAPLPRLLVLFVMFMLAFGSAFIWDGILLRDVLPRAARGLEELGICMVFLAFFALVTSILPVDLIWAAGLCYLLTVLPIIVLWFHDAGGTA